MSSSPPYTVVVPQHRFTGSPVQPDLFERVLLMSVPFTGAPLYATPRRSSEKLASRRSWRSYANVLAAQQPRRKHHAPYVATAEGNAGEVYGDEEPGKIWAFIITARVRDGEKGR